MLDFFGLTFGVHYKTGSIYLDENNPEINTKDVEEMSGHFRAFNYTLKIMDEQLSEIIIKQMHAHLKEDVFEDKANGYAIGEYKTRENRVSDITTALPSEVCDKMKELLNNYNLKENISINDIALFHSEFEKIHPF